MPLRHQACGSATPCSIMLAHTSWRRAGGTVGLGQPRAAPAPPSAAATTRARAAAAARAGPPSGSTRQAPRLRIGRGQQRAAGAEERPPVEHRAGLQPDHRQPLGHAPRHLGVQPRRVVGARAAARSTRASATRVERARGRCARGLAAPWAGSILSRCLARPAAARRGCRLAQPVRGLPPAGAASALCRDCVDALRTRRAPRCERCAPARCRRGVAVCGACLREPPPFERSGLRRRLRLSLGRPDRRLQVPRPRSNWPARWRRAWRGPRRRAGRRRRRDLLLPVPLAPARLARARLQPGLGTGAPRRPRAAAAGRAPTCCCAPARHAAPGRPAARASAQRNLRGAFMVEPRRARRRCAGRHVALVDDVMTTGATAREAARGAAARRRGARRRVGAGAHAAPDASCTASAACSTSCSSHPRSRPTPAT